MNVPEVTVGTFDEIESARRLEAALKELGIDSDLSDDSAVQEDFLRVPPRASYHVQVKKEDVVRAERALLGWQEQYQSLVTCPSCGKSKITFPQVSRKFQHSMWPVLLLIKAGLMEPSYFCETCNYQWSARLPEPEATRDVHPPE